MGLLIHGPNNSNMCQLSAKENLFDFDSDKLPLECHQLCLLTGSSTLAGRSFLFHSFQSQQGLCCSFIPFRASMLHAAQSFHSEPAGGEDKGGGL